MSSKVLKMYFYRTLKHLKVLLRWHAVLVITNYIRGKLRWSFFHGQLGHNYLDPFLTRNSSGVLFPSTVNTPNGSLRPFSTSPQNKKN